MLYLLIFLLLSHNTVSYCMNGQLWMGHDKGDDFEDRHSDTQEAFYKPTCADESFDTYEKLESSLRKSSIAAAPEALRLRIGLLHNPRSRQLLQQETSSSNRLLLYGPPGTGKSTLAKAIADHCQFPRRFISAPSIPTQYKNSGPQNLRSIFMPLFNVQDNLVVILDELAGLICRHKNTNYDEGTVETLLGILDLCETHQNVFFIATTNEIKNLPVQIKDRFCGSIFKIVLPNNRISIIQARFGKRGANVIDSNAAPIDTADDMDIGHMPVITLGLSEGERIVIEKKTSGFSARQVNALTDYAKIFGIARAIDENFNIVQTVIMVNKEDFQQALVELHKIKAEVSESNWKMYKEFFKEFYPLAPSAVSTGIGLYLQYRSNQQHLALAIAHNLATLNLSKQFQTEQMEFQKQAHRDQLELQERLHKGQAAQQLELQRTAHVEQMNLTKEFQKKQEGKTCEQRACQAVFGLACYVLSGVSFYFGCVPLGTLVGQAGTSSLFASMS